MKLTPAEMRIALEKVHSSGAARHSTRWLSANEAAVNAMRANCVPTNDPALKLLVATTVLKVLDAVIPKEQR